MGYLDLAVLALSLCFDTFSVSLSGGLTLSRRLSVAELLRIILTFGLFQSLFVFIGWLLGLSVGRYFMAYDHWVAFGILALLGVKMIADSCSTIIKWKRTSGKEGTASVSSVDASDVSSAAAANVLNLLDYKKVLLLAVATSIDAVAVGVSLSFIHLELFHMIFESLAVLLFTVMASYAGIRISRFVGSRLGDYSGLVGGVILILIGVRILIEHLG